MPIHALIPIEFCSGIFRKIGYESRRKPGFDEVRIVLKACDIDVVLFISPCFVGGAESRPANMNNMILLHITRLS